MKRPWLIPALILLALAVVLLCGGCGGVGVTFSKMPTFAVQVAVLGIPTPPLQIGPRYPRVACYGYQSGYVMAGASSRHVYKAAMG